MGLVGGDILEGQVEYQTSDGWKIVVFSDGDVWDYVRSMFPQPESMLRFGLEQEQDDCEGFREFGLTSRLLLN